LQRDLAHRHAEDYLLRFCQGAAVESCSYTIEDNPWVSVVGPFKFQNQREIVIIRLWGQLPYVHDSHVSGSSCPDSDANRYQSCGKSKQPDFAHLSSAETRMLYETQDCMSQGSTDVMAITKWATGPGMRLSGASVLFSPADEFHHERARMTQNNLPFGRA
jgi:hypothetical protein